LCKPAYRAPDAAKEEEYSLLEMRESLHEEGIEARHLLEIQGDVLIS
jgi:hypothetical protein